MLPYRNRGRRGDICTGCFDVIKRFDSYNRCGMCNSVQHERCIEKTALGDNGWFYYRHSQFCDDCVFDGFRNYLNLLRVSGCKTKYQIEKLITKCKK